MSEEIAGKVIGTVFGESRSPFGVLQFVRKGLKAPEPARVVGFKRRGELLNPAL
jgi:hypothetical protein